MSNFDFKKIEEEILDFWEKNDTFEKSVALRRAQGKTPFVFFEGPPTANAKPAIHHFIGRVFKDAFCRYKTMRGFLVERKSGWDTHGLPVEIEVEKKLGLKSKKEIETYGIAKFNRQAKESVWQYKEEWEKFTKKIGFWIDLKNPYITYNPKYIESLWWILKKVWDKKLLFKGHKVVPFCTRCGTALSSHEVAQGYRTITDKSVIVKFKVKSKKFKVKDFSKPITYNLEPETYLLAWTTTPWTLPGNVALAVGENINYAIVEQNGESYIVAKDLVEKVFGSSSYKLQVTSFKGSDLVGLEYEPLFDILKLKSQKSYKIYPADFVTTEDGTGVVHTAVMYGEDDYNLGKKIGLPTQHTVDEQGKFVGVSKELDGKYVKDKETEDLVIRELEIRNLVFKTSNFEHDYPFCWRCGTSLLYYAKNSWFIGMSELEKKLTGNNKKVNWYPGHLKEGRFGEWLRGVKDWAISRERYWGTPLPVWVHPNGNFQFPISNFQTNSKIKNKKFKKNCDNLLVIGSYEDLEKFRFRAKNNYFLMRHGMSTKNIDNIVSSRLENDSYPLTEEGRKNVKAEAVKLKKEKIDLIFSSFFQRCKETAGIVSEATGAKVYFDERLKEIDHGSGCEGKSGPVCLPDGLANIPDMNFKFGDGENWNGVRKRMMDFVLETDGKYEGKNILIVGHGDPLAALTGTLKGLSDRELLDMLRGYTGSSSPTFVPKEELGSSSPTFVPKEELGSSQFLDKENSHNFYPKKGKAYKVELKNWPWDENGCLNPHRPYVDEVFLKCSKCGGKMQRIKEIADVWFDSGAMPYAQWHYPFENKKTFSKSFPADFISEGIDQTRGWFYTLLAISTLLGKGPAYKNVISYSHVLDEKGQKMSKSKGNVVDPWMVMDKFGVDAARWYFYSVNNPGDPKLFSLDDVALRLRGFVMTLWNSFNFFNLYNLDNKDFPADFHKNQPAGLLDKWIIFCLSQTAEAVAESMDNYDPTTATRAIEQFVVEDFSKWWLRRSRSKFQKPESERTLKESLSLLRFLLLEISKLIAPFAPFIAEKLHGDLHKGTIAGAGSVHFHDFPSPKNYKLKTKNYKLLKDMEKVRKFVNLGLAQRKDKQLKVRQPLSSVTLKRKEKFASELEELLKEELNIKEVRYDQNLKEDIALDTHLTQELTHEGWARELVRQIQDMRKEAGYKFSDKITIQWHTENGEVKKAIEIWDEFLKKSSLAKEFSMSPHTENLHFDLQKEFEIETNKKIWIGVRKQ